MVENLSCEAAARTFRFALTVKKKQKTIDYRLYNSDTPTKERSAENTVC